jgi:hypothetical protein
MCGRFANMPIVHYRGMQWHYWLIFFMVALVLHMLIIADTAAATTTVDTNQVVNPCAQLQPIKSGDAITVAVALGGSRVLWYNHSDPLSNLLSPCSPSTATIMWLQQVPVGAQVAVFRPVVDQLSLFQIQNDSLLAVTSTVSPMFSTLSCTI